MALFPRLADCSHFHYENSGVTQFKVKVRDIDKGQLVISITSHENGWDTRRTWSQTVAMDEQFHECIISRATTNLRSLRDVPFLQPARSSSSLVVEDYQENRPVQRSSHSRNGMEEEYRLVEEHRPALMKIIKEYFASFSGFTSTPINCAPILNYFEMDNHGYRLNVPDEDMVNKPAVAAAEVIRRHVAQDTDEISLEVGNMVSILDMPSDTPWWRGKFGIRVGFFPAECVSVFGSGKASGPPSPGLSGPNSEAETGSYKQVALSRGKVISRLVWALFGKPRPTALQLRRKGILRDRVFGCDLGVYLSATRREVPLPLMVCAQIIEDHGLVDGIYRRSGGQTHVQELRRYFDEDQRPPMDSDLIESDIHSFSSMLKIYFGELPTPLFNSGIYSLLSATLREENEAERLNSTFRVLSRLAPPYFRTARYLFVHLNKLASHAEKTLMTAKNLAICWAPNLIKPTRKIDYDRPQPSLFLEVRENPLIVEYIITYARQLFSDRPPNWGEVLAAKSAARHSCVANLSGGGGEDLISLAEARRRYGCKSSITLEPEDTGTKQRTRSVIESPRRSSFDLDGDVFARPCISGPFPTGSPPLARPRGIPSLQNLQQKQNLLIRQQKQRQTEAPVDCPDGRPRCHSLAGHETKPNCSPGASGLISGSHPEQTKRQKRLRLPFSPPTRLSRAKSAASSLLPPPPPPPSAPPSRVGSSTFYLRANSAPTGQPPALPAAISAVSASSLPSQPSIRLSKEELAFGRSSLRSRSRPRERSASPPLLSGLKEELAFGRSSLRSRSRPRERSPSPQDPIGEKENMRSSFQVLQHSWERRSDRGWTGPILPLDPASHSSSSSSSSSTPAASPRSMEEEGQITPTQASPPILIRARPSPTAPLPSCRLSLPNPSSPEPPRKAEPEPPIPRPRQRPRPAFQRHSPVRQSLPTRMDRLLTRFPTDMRCYLPETNV